MLKTNVGFVDRVVRVIVGLALLSLFFIYPGATWRYGLLVGLVPLLTGLFGTCPLYTLLGISTCPARSA